MGGWGSGGPAPAPEEPLSLCGSRPGRPAPGRWHLESALQAVTAVAHEIGGADGSRAAAAVLAVHEAGAAVAHRSLHGGTGGLQVRQQVFRRVVEHGHAQLGHSGSARPGLLAGDVDAQSDARAHQQLRRARGSRVPDEERGGDARERRRCGLRGTHDPGNPRVSRGPRLADSLQWPLGGDLTTSWGGAAPGFG